jgi:polyadenylate-binding protein
MSAINSTISPSASLYVGDLHETVTEALLYEMFNAVGPVVSVRVCRDFTTRRSLGYAYVNFHRPEDAERALDTMNFKMIRNKPCRIMWSIRDPSLRKSNVGNIFVKGLAPSIDNKQLYDTFSIFGNILSCKVSTDAEGKSLGYGFVHYESEDAALKAIAKVNDKIIKSGDPVTVTHFKSKKDRGGNEQNTYTNVYVKNIPLDYSEEKLREFFNKFGDVQSCVISKDKNDPTISKGFGFVNFQDAASAVAAVEGLNGFEISADKKLYVGRAQKKAEREKELRDKFEHLKQERQKKYAGVNLYIKNLADEITEERLKQEFSKFGSITSAKIMVDGNGKNKGFGFVCYTSPEEATKAVTEMNGRMLEGKPLYVALAQRKEARRAQLEQQHSSRNKMAGIPTPAMGYAPQPMFYPGMPQGRIPMYPQQMVPRRWHPAQAGPAGAMPNMMNLQQGRPVNFQLMPMSNNRMNQPNRRQRNNNHRNGQAQQGQPQVQEQAQGQAQTQPQAKQVNANGMQAAGQFNNNYTENNRVQPVAQQQQAQAAAQESNNPNEPLTISALAAADPAQQKRVIGERLYLLVKAQQPQLAGKITGMLLEMDNGELLHLLESPQALTEKLEEAMHVLNGHDLDGILAEQESAFEESANKA